MLYEEALREQIEYIKNYIRNPNGILQGYVTYDNFGNVVTRVGRQTLNPPWYSEFYRKHGRKPRMSEVEGLAREHIENGFWDNGYFVPPYYLR